MIEGKDYNERSNQMWKSQKKWTGLNKSIEELCDTKRNVPK